MAETLAKIRANFILSINDRPEIWEIFKDFKFKPVQIKYSVKKR